MTGYLLLKWVHVLSSVALVGTGFGTAYYLASANRQRDVAALAVVTRLVVRADWWFTTPAAIVQPLTGVWLASLSGWPLSTPWLACSIALYLLAGACWLPVLWLQLRMAAMATDAQDHQRELPLAYWRHARTWERLGYPAFASMLAVYYLMVAKPDLSF